MFIDSLVEYKILKEELKKIYLDKILVCKINEKKKIVQ
jgi:hypothetical protein